MSSSLQYARQLVLCARFEDAWHALEEPPAEAERIEAAVERSRCAVALRRDPEEPLASLWTPELGAEQRAVLAAARAEHLLAHGDKDAALRALEENAPPAEPTLGRARWHLQRARVALHSADARAGQRFATEGLDALGSEPNALDPELGARLLLARADAHAQQGAEVHARRDRDRARVVLEQVGAELPAELRLPYWSVTWRKALRNAESGGGTLSEGALREASPSVLGGAVTRGRFGSVSMLLTSGALQDPRMGMLLDLSRRVAEEHTLPRVLEQVLRCAVELTGAERAAALLLDGEGVLQVAARSGSGREGPDDGFSRSIAETVLIDGEPVVTFNAQGDQRFLEYRSVHDLAITSVLAAPVRARGRALGVLYLENRLRRAQWSPPEVALVQAFAEQAGVAVDNARLVDELTARTHELEAARRQIEGLLAERTTQLDDTRQNLERATQALRGRFSVAGLVGGSEALARVVALVERLRESEVPVVLEGESGTGKELVARSLHHGGARARGPFVVVHCAAIPESLLESELFGHVRGAFTGAERDRKGLLASAEGGTVLLDDVGEMPSRMQVELLRVLQERKVRPVGAEKEVTLDVRFLASSSRPLRDLVAEGRFREDLYYRLAVVTVPVPPLRERAGDIALLAQHFLARVAEEHRVPRKRLSRTALERLERAPWPGNVRQLQHVLESAAVLCDGEVIEPEALGLGAERVSSVPAQTRASAQPAEGSSPPLPPQKQRKVAEKQRILDALEKTNWNKVKAATVLGMPRRTLYRRLREYGLLDE